MVPIFQDFSIYNVPVADKFDPAYLGNKNDDLLIGCNSPDFANDEIIKFLAKILQAVKLDLEKDAYLFKVTPQHIISFSELKKECSPRQLIAFGLLPAQLGLNFKPIWYAPFEHLQTTFLFADDLELIYRERQEGGKEKSGRLWQALQRIFL